MATTSVRLTNDVRNTLIEAALLNYRQPEKDALQKAVEKFGLELYQHEFGKAGPVALALGPRWYETDTEIVVKCDGFAHNYEARSDCLCDHIQLGAEKVFPPNANGYGNHVSVDEDHPLYRKARMLVETHRAIRKAEKDVRAKVQAIVYACKTVKQLQESWPEGMRFLPEGSRPIYAIVPVGLTDQVNRALGLAPNYVAEAISKAKS
jgi:Nucleotide modification associated domain 5